MGTFAVHTAAMILSHPPVGRTTTTATTRCPSARQRPHHLRLWQGCEQNLPYAMTSYHLTTILMCHLNHWHCFSPLCVASFVKSCSAHNFGRRAVCAPVFARLWS